MKRFALLAILALVTFASKADAGEGKWGGYVFGDAFMFAGHHVRAYKGLTGFQIRRLYLNYDYDFGDGWKSRARFELSHTDQNTAGPGATAVPFAKDLWLKKTIGNHSGIFGISPTPTFGTYESFWGYRAVEKAPVDLQGWRSSRDTGIAFKGSFDDDKMFGYHVMAGNGNSNRQELNHNKQFAAEFIIKPIDGLVISIYGDYVNNDTCGGGALASGAGLVQQCVPNTAEYMGHIFIGYKGDWGRVGVSWDHFVDEQVITGVRWPENGNVLFDAADDPRMEPDAHMNLFSVFGVAKLADKWNAYARYDYLDYPMANKPTYFNSEIDSARMHFMVAGLDYSPVKNVHILPNIEIMAYGRSIMAESTGLAGGTNSRVLAAGGQARPIVIPRLTFFWKFK